MKSILIIGTADAGKSTTMREVCRRLKPTNVYKLLPDTKIHKNSTLQDSDVEKIFNDTFIIKIKEKLILVVAGAPTEQRIRLKILIEICIEINIEISFFLVSKRLTERISGFDTVTELADKSQILLSKRIYRISGEKFMDEKEWNERIDSIVTLINKNI
ncbi:MAG: hypothetical protein K2Q03_05520 [Sphingobacteriaceae bacterium]|nr:hypothetical protein [Sphingobacteriaceae bacterium]